MPSIVLGLVLGVIAIVAMELWTRWLFRRAEKPVDRSVWHCNYCGFVGGTQAFVDHLLNVHTGENK